MKKLTQAVFDNAPKWVKSAAVDKRGTAWGYSESKSRLMVGKRDWYSDSWLSDIWLFNGEYDTTDWQNSSIDREVTK